MQKKIFITNGMARCGKDTFAEILNRYVPTQKVSSIDQVKRIAKNCGWNGKKDEKSRKFLSDLKILLTDYNDLLFKSISDAVYQFKEESLYNVLLIDIREPIEIERAKSEFNANTILIRRNSVQNITSNPADAGVFDYNYDYIIDNNGTLDDFEGQIIKFGLDVGIIGGENE